VDDSKTVKRLKPLKYVKVDRISSYIFIPLLTYICNLSATNETFPSLWEQAAPVEVLETGRSAAVND
jgi:hypothetical protein